MVSKQKPEDKKKKKKSSQLVIRIDKGERDAFVALCDALDTSAAREIRRFMRGWVAAHAQDLAATGVAPQPEAEPPAAEVPALPEAAEPAKPRRRRASKAVE